MYKEIYNTSPIKPSVKNLPLSWTFNYGTNYVAAIELGRESIWLKGGSFNNVDVFLSSVKKYSKKQQVIIRGCNSTVTSKLKENGFHETLFAKEAIIELQKEIPISNKLKRRIKSLLNRGKVKEVIHTKENTELFEIFLKETIHWEKPQLKHLFLNNFSNSTRLFVFEIHPNKWEGAILISQNSDSKMQGEQFFRRKNGLNGIMDTLVVEICKTLKREGYSEFSLGEVPFVATDREHYFSKTNFIRLIGKQFKFAYNYSGLFDFKNKFATKWENLFICTKNRLNYIDIYRIAKESNLIKLVFYKILN